MTRHRRADRDVRGFDVANLTNHHNVRVLPQNVTETFGKGQIDLRLNVDLGHARQPIFHRLFDGDDAPLNGIDAAQEAIKRRRFSAASRAGEKNDSVRLREQMANDLLLLFAQIEPIEPELLLAAAEQTQTDGFAVHGGNSRDADVDVLIVRLQIHAAILGQPTLSDVHVRHYFQARDDGRLQHTQLRRHRDFVQNSVDSIPNSQIVFERFNVNIGGALDNCFANDLVHEFYH